MRTFSLLAILTVITGTLFTSAAPLGLVVNVAARVNGPVWRGLTMNHVSGIREKHDEAGVRARWISILALTKRFGNLVHDSALANTRTIRKRQPHVTDHDVQARTEAQVDAAANIDLLLKRDPVTVEARTEARVDAVANVDLLLKRDPAAVEARTEARVGAAANIDLLLKRDPVTVEARTEAQVDAVANIDLLLKRDPATVAQAQVDALANVDLLFEHYPAAVVKGSETVVWAGLGALFGGLRRDLTAT